MREKRSSIFSSGRNAVWTSAVHLIDISALFIVIVRGSIPLHQYHRVEDRKAAHERDLVCKIQRKVLRNIGRQEARALGSESFTIPKFQLK